MNGWNLFIYICMKQFIKLFTYICIKQFINLFTYKCMKQSYVSEWMKFATDTNYRPKTIIRKSVCTVWKSWETLRSNHCTIFYDTPSQEQTKGLTIISSKRKVGKNQEKMKRKQEVCVAEKNINPHITWPQFHISSAQLKERKSNFILYGHTTHILKSNECNHSPLGMYNPQDTTSHQLHHGQLSILFT